MGPRDVEERESGSQNEIDHRELIVVLNPCPNCSAERDELHATCGQCGWSPEPDAEENRFSVLQQAAQQLQSSRTAPRRDSARDRSDSIATQPASPITTQSMVESIKQSDRVSLAGLVVANLMPLIGVLFFRWDALAIVLLYWWENIVTGGFAILRIGLAAEDEIDAHLRKLFLIPFFCVHFGFFCAVHGMFLLSLPRFVSMDADSFPIHSELSNRYPIPIAMLIGRMSEAWNALGNGAAWALGAIVVGHGLSFIRNYLVRGEFRRTNAATEMTRPYGRIVFMHVAIIFMALPTALLGSRLPLLILLVLMKIGVDVLLHCYSHHEPTDP